MKFKKLVALAAVSVVAVGLVGCGQSKEDSKKTADVSNSKVIVVGATANPHAEILNQVVKPILEKKGYKLETKVFNDYVLPNKALSDKSLDANYFQHEPYLKEYNKKNNADLVATVKVHVEPMGIYSDKVKNLKDLKDGAIISVPNDPTNESRALKLLDKEGVIKVSNKELLTKNDITSNPKKVEIKELAAEQLPNTLKDVDASVINSNYALEGKLNPTKDSLAIEDKDNPYANIIVVRPDEKDLEKIKALGEAMTSLEVKKFIEEKYNGAIIPSF